MSKSPLRRASLAGLATAAMVVSLSGYGVTAASADSSFRFDRVAGHNRFETSVAAAKIFGASTDVILANGEAGHYPDALTANYLAGSKKEPILLTQVNTTPSSVSDYLKSSNVKNITIVGGPLAVSSAQEASLTAAGYTVNRIQGTGSDTSRYGTAKAVSAAVGGTHDTAVLSTGEAFPDAVASGPLSYTKQFPLTITRPNSLPQSTKDALTAAGVKHVVIAGGTLAVSDAVVAQLKALGIDVTFRAAGSDRSDTSVKLAQYELANYGFTNTRVNVASGQDNLKGADALSGGPVTGMENRALLITRDKDNAGASLLQFLKDNAKTLTGTDNHIFGGPLAVSDLVAQQMEASAGSTTAPSGPVTLKNSSVVQGGTFSGTIDNPGTINSVSVTGCGFNNENVAVASDGTFTETLPAGQPVGSCTLTFNILRTDGTTQSQDVPLTVTAAPSSTTAAPDLLSAAADTTNDVVTYTFDQNVTGKSPAAGDFYVYDASGKVTQATTVSATGSKVIAQFPGGSTTGATLAAENNGSVSDAAGHDSYASSAPLNQQTQAAGVTTAPDLQSVDNLRTVGGVIVADFRFDEAVTQASATAGSGAGKFVLVANDGTTYPSAVGVPSLSVDGRTVTVTFPTTAGVPIGNVVRGAAEQGAVMDTTGNANPTETEPRTAPPAFTAGSTADRTNDPDVTSVKVAGPDTVAYTFDEPVDTPVAGNFFVYDASATQTPGSTAVRSSTDTSVVNVTYPTGIVANAVGAGVEGAAVHAIDNSHVNEVDEMGLQSVTNTAGRTALPDLSSVKISTDAFGNNTVVYTFDQNVTDGVASHYGLIDANGTRFTPGAVGVPTGNTVTFTGFTNSQAAAAVVGNYQDPTPTNGNMTDPTTGDVQVQR